MLGWKLGLREAKSLKVIQIATTPCFPAPWTLSVPLSTPVKGPGGSYLQLIADDWQGHQRRH